MSVPTPPSTLSDRGCKLWVSIHEQHPEMNDIEREVALEACRVVDRLEWLDEVCRSEMPTVEGKQGPMANPAYAEARQQQNLLKMLVASLRIPDADSGKRPQQRGSARGGYAGSAERSAPGVTSLRDRMRKSA